MNRVKSKSSQGFGDLQFLRPYEVEGGESRGDKRRAMLDVAVKRKMHLEEDHSCDCKNFCLDPKITDLEVSYENFCF